MSIELGEKTVGMWCVEMGGKANWLAHLSRGAEPHKFELTYRVRYYDDDKVFDSNDRRNWYHGQITGLEANVLRKVRAVFDGIREVYGYPGWELLRGARSVEDFAGLLRAMPGIHVGEPA